MNSPSPNDGSSSQEDLFLLEDDLPEKKKRQGGQLKTLGMVLSVLITGSVLCTAAGLAVSSFFHHIPFIKDELSKVEYPVAGDHHTLAAVKSQWLYVDDLPPTQRADMVINTGTEYVPELTIQLAPRDQSGQLRVFFENEEGKLTGDPITLTVEKGAFAKNGQATIAVTGSAGLRNDPQYYASLTKVTGPWTALILEGPLHSDSIADYQELLRVELGSSLKK